MIIIKQYDLDNFIKYYVYKDINKAVLFVSKRCNINKDSIVIDTIYREEYKNHEYFYIISLAEKGDI